MRACQQFLFKSVIQKSMVYQQKGRGTVFPRISPETSRHVCVCIYVARTFQEYPQKLRDTCLCVARSSHDIHRNIVTDVCVSVKCGLSENHRRIAICANRCVKAVQFRGVHIYTYLHVCVGVCDCVCVSVCVSVCAAALQTFQRARLQSTIRAMESRFS